MKRFMMVLGMTAMSLNAWAAGQPSLRHTPGVMPTPDPNGNPVHYVSTRLRMQMMQIHKDQKAGKLTKAQADAARKQVNDIRKKEIGYLRQNGNKKLTSTQQADLTSQLDANAHSIP